MRYILAALLVAHGVAHIVGFAVPWHLVASPEVPYKTTVFAGRIDLGPVGIRVVGLLWLATAILFVIAAADWLRDPASALAVVAAAVCISVMLCAIEWPLTRVGLAVNLGIIIALLVRENVARLLRS